VSKKSECGLFGVGYIPPSQTNLIQADIHYDMKKPSNRSTGRASLGAAGSGTKVPNPSRESIRLGNKSTSQEDVPTYFSTGTGTDKSIRQVDFLNIQKFKSNEKRSEDFRNISSSVDEILQLASQRVTALQQDQRRDNFVEEIKIESETDEADTGDVILKDKEIETKTNVEMESEPKKHLISVIGKAQTDFTDEGVKESSTEIELKSRAKAPSSSRARSFFRRGLLNPWSSSKKAQDEAKAIASGTLGVDSVDRIDLVGSFDGLGKAIHLVLLNLV